MSAPSAHHSEAQAATTSAHTDSEPTHAAPINTKAHTAIAAPSPPPPAIRAHTRTSSRIPVPAHMRAASGQAAPTSAASAPATAAVPPAAAPTAAAAAPPVSARTKPTTAAAAARTVPSAAAAAAAAARAKRPEAAASAAAASSSSSAAAAAPAPASSASAVSSASARHSAYLASLVAARAAREREERRRKPAIKDRLTSTFTMSAQKHTMGSGAADASSAAASLSASAGASAAAPLDRLSAAKDAEYAALLPRVFSMLGGSSIDCLRRAFTEAGWVENPSERSRVWSIQWSIVGRVIDYASLGPGQIVNHFERAHAITSKVGLCGSIHLVRNYDAAASDFFPRCFELHKHEAEGLRAFRDAWLEGVCLNYAGRFVRSYQREHGNEEKDDADDVTGGGAMDDEDEPADVASTAPLPPLSSFDPELVQLCFVAFQALLRRRRFEVDGLDNALPVAPPAKGAGAGAAPQAAAAAGVAYAQLSDEEWTRLETEVERLEQIDRDADTVRQKVRRKAEAAAAAVAAAAATDSGDSESKSNDAYGEAASTPEPSPDPAAADCDDARAAAAQEDEEELDAELDRSEEATAEATSPSPEPAAAAAEEAASLPSAESEAESEAPSLARLSLLARSPLLPFSVLSSHLRALFLELRCCDPQHFSLVAPHTRNLWILKPGGLSRGRGIEVHASYASLLATLQRGGSFVAQQYIERPLLVRRKKFDLRQWVLVSNFASVLCVWFYRAGCYVRFSSKDYTPFATGAGASSIHLTNNSIQKHEADFNSLTWAPGNMWSSAQLCAHLHEALPRIHAAIPQTRVMHSGSAVWADYVQPAMMRIARLTISAGFQDRLEPRPNSFSLYGFDYMLSADLQPWLIEVNSSPTLVGIAVPHMVDQMSRDLVRIVTQDAHSPASPLWREKIDAEKARLAAEKQAQAEQESEADKEKQPSQMPTKGAGPGKKSADAKRSVNRAGSSSSSAAAASSAASSAAAAAAATSAADPFVLPVPHPVGHRVGGFEVVDCLYIGSVPRSHRTNPAAAAAASGAGTATGSGEEKSAAAAANGAGKNNAAAVAGGSADREKKAPAQPTGLFVTGKSIPNPAAAAAATGPASKLARAGSSSALRRAPSATAAAGSVPANSKAKPRG